MFKKPVIVFEGIEGSGKSHHILNVSKFLKKNKIDFIKLREPGGNHNSEQIRKLILNKKSNFRICFDTNNVPLGLRFLTFGLPIFDFIV